MAADMEKWVGQYVWARDAIAKVTEEYEQKKKPLVDILDQLTGKIQKFMSENNIENVKTDAGTAYTTVRHSASLADPAAFMEYVIKNKKFELLDRRANVTAVRDHVKSTGALPAGCNLSTIETVNVRRRPGT